jgi:hypothetical protein
MQREPHAKNVRKPGIADGDDFGPFGCGVRCECECRGRGDRDAEDGEIRIRVYRDDLRFRIDLSIEDIHGETGALFDHMGISDQ